MSENPTKGKSREGYHSASGRGKSGVTVNLPTFSDVNRACTRWLIANDPKYSSNGFRDYHFGKGRPGPKS